MFIGSRITMFIGSRGSCPSRFVRERGAAAEVRVACDARITTVRHDRRWTDARAIIRGQSHATAMSHHVSSSPDADTV